MAARPRSRSRSRRRRRRPRRGGSDLPARVLVAIPAIAFAIFIIASGGWVLAGGAFVLGVLCLHELFRMYEALRPVKLAGFIGLAGLTVAAELGDERQVLLAAVAFVPVIFLLALAMPSRDERSGEATAGGEASGRDRKGSARGRITITEGMAITVFGVFWVGMGVAHAILLRGTPHGDGIMIDVLVGTFVGDTGAYLGGRSFGTRRLAPRISPNKTVEGLVIGFVVAVLATWCAGLYQDWLSHGQALLLGVAVGLAAPLGDLFESQVKRDAGAKDAGSVFGAHGGALDRLDAAFFTLIAGYYVWLALL